MTAADYLSLAAVKAVETATYLGLTEQAVLTGRVHDHAHSWEPAAK